ILKNFSSFSTPMKFCPNLFACATEALLNDKIKLEKVIGEAFDLIYNGEKLLSGSLRIYQ
ncbi:13742_t:CDS:1, partial [Dentiscutata erythropus]